MSQPIKVFEVEETDAKPPKAFEVVFKGKDGAEKGRHTLHAYGEAPVGTSFKLAATVRYDKHDRPRIDLVNLMKFLGSVMPEDEFDRLNDLLNDPELLVPMETLTAIYQWLTEEYFERPTPRSPTSSDGRPTTGTSSGAQLSSVE